MVAPFAKEGFAILYARDITLQKQAKRELEDSEKRYRAVVNDQIEMICRYTPDGLITFANRAFADYAGIELAEISGVKLENIISDEIVEEFTLSLDKLSEETAPLLPWRPPALCPGCPHRASHYAIRVASRRVARDLGKEVEPIYPGDIGCHLPDRVV